MCSSLGGFTSEYMAMKLQVKAIMINPETQPSELLKKYIDNVSENFETQQPFSGSAQNCEQFVPYEQELMSLVGEKNQRVLLLDMADELIDSAKTQEKYNEIAEVFTYEGGSHSFEHIKEALPVIKSVIVS